uniref:Uncharacterized protein n=1 Tax=Anguilla anguilla TaxID=7936 RepID=A0A0E9S118_ANGAN
MTLVLWHFLQMIFHIEATQGSSSHNGNVKNALKSRDCK